MTKVIKVSDETHERLTALKGDGETIDDVITRQLAQEHESPIEKVTRELQEFKAFIEKIAARTVTTQTTQDIKVDLESRGLGGSTFEKNTSEATPQRVSNRKTAGGGGAKSTFTPKDTPQPLEQACCAGKSPCKHWSYEANEMMYVNSLSGRRKAPEE